MDHNIVNDYDNYQLLKASCNSTVVVYLDQWWQIVYQSYKQTQYSKPLPWIGIYIALASLFCVLAMAADLLHSSVPFPSSSRKCKIVIQHLKILNLSICIGFQKTVVVACKIIAVIPILIAVIPVLFVICIKYCIRRWKGLKAMFSAPSIVLGQDPAQPGIDTDLRQYGLQLQEDIEFAERTLKGISKSVNRLIRKAEKQQPKNLMKLLAESRGFEGVGKFDLPSAEYLNCWSLPLVTLTSIAMSLPDIQKIKVDCLVSGVSEGLVYVKLVEESLNATNDHVSIQKAAKTLWVEVEVYHKWLGNKQASNP